MTFIPETIEERMRRPMRTYAGEIHAPRNNEAIMYNNLYDFIRIQLHKFDEHMNNTTSFYNNFIKEFPISYLDARSKDDYKDLLSRLTEAYEKYRLEFKAMNS